jgi:hypothetical protein
MLLIKLLNRTLAVIANATSKVFQLSLKVTYAVGNVRTKYIKSQISKQIGKQGVLVYKDEKNLEAYVKAKEILEKANQASVDKVQEKFDACEDKIKLLKQEMNSYEL